MHLDDESWNGWAVEAPHGSVDPYAEFVDDGLDAESQQLGQDLMSFLSDFRSALSGEDGAESADPADSSSGIAPETAAARPGSRHAVAPQQSAWVGDPYQGSEYQIDPGWWMASDGRWYPPELHPDRTEEEPASSSDQPEAGTEAERPAAASRSELPGRGSRFTLGRPRLGRLGQSAATA